MNVITNLLIAFNLLVQDYINPGYIGFLWTYMSQTFV